MKKLKELKRAEPILTEQDIQEFIQPVDKLPEPNAEWVNKSVLVSTYKDSELIGMTYKCVGSGSGYEWKLVNYYEPDPTAPCVNIWANCVRDEDTGRAVVYIHWKDPDDTDSTHWAYSVIVKKKGNIPMSLYDGEIVGYSSIRNQYSYKNGFVDSVDADCVDNNDILENLEFGPEYEYILTEDEYRNINKTYYLKEGSTYREARPKDFPEDGRIKGLNFYEDPNRYYYNVFAVSKFGKVRAGTGCGPCLSWIKFQELVANGVANYALNIGDVVQVKHEGLGRTIDLQVVAFDNPIPEGCKHGVTFMSCDVLFRASFDHLELAYARTIDTEWKNKPYFIESETHYDNPSPITDRSSYRSPQDYPEPLYERNPLFRDGNITKVNGVFMVVGRNTWIDSNARQWLNSDKDADHWFEAKTIFDLYSNDVTYEGAYGTPSLAPCGMKLFPGFLHGLDEELFEVMRPCKINTTLPIWKREDPEVVSLDEPTIDYVFLPAYIEIFGKNKTFPADVSEAEGRQFDYYEQKIAKTRMKTILLDHNTTPPMMGESDLDNLASWWMRTPVRMDEVETTETKTQVDCVEMVTSKNRRFDDIRDLDEDGGAGRQCYMPASGSGLGDIPRDMRNNTFVPVGTKLTFYNNTSPGFVPCLVVGGGNAE